MRDFHTRFVAVALTSAIAFATGCANKASTTQAALGLSREPAPVNDIGKGRSGFDAAHPPLSHREPWTFAEQSGQLITTPNYLIYTTISSERILDRLPLFYESALEHYTTALAKLPKPDQPLKTYLFQTRGQWQAKTQEMLPDQAKMFEGLGRGGFTTRSTSVLYYIDRGGSSHDTFAIAAHEGWHQYTQQTFKHQLPIWLEEGIATYMEGYRTGQDGVAEFMPAANFERRMALRDAMRKNRMIPMTDLLTRSPQSFLTSSKDSLLTYYAQVWALTRFLAEGENGRYADSLAAVLSEAADGKMVSRVMTSTANGALRRRTSGAAGPAVVQEYFNPDLTEFEAQYLAFVDQLVQSRER